MNEKTEQCHLTLLDEMQAELSAALLSVTVGHLSAVNRYIYQMCSGISDTVDGYMTLKKAGKNSASRIFVRPCVEVAFRLTAVLKKPATLFQIAYTEHREDGKFLDDSAKNGIKVDLAAHAAKWQKQKPQIAALFPGEQLKETELKAFDLARIGGMQQVYSFQYRVYCNFTHGTLRALFSWPDKMPELDYSTIAVCLHVALVGLKSIGCNCPQLPTFGVRLNQLIQPEYPP